MSSFWQFFYIQMSIFRRVRTKATPVGISADSEGEILALKLGCVNFNILVDFFMEIQKKKKERPEWRSLEGLLGRLTYHQCTVVKDIISPRLYNLVLIFDPVHLSEWWVTVYRAVYPLVVPSRPRDGGRYLLYHRPVCGVYQYIGQSW